jgi:malonate decarboxylase beta subunit
MIPLPAMATPSFQELSPRERLAALFDDDRCTEMLGPFDRIGSSWLAQQGLVSQSDDGVVVVRGCIDGKEAVGVAIEPRHEGGSIGEVGGAKIASALQLAASSCLSGRPIAAVLLLETGGVRLQEATLGLAAIGEIHDAIINLRGLAPVIAVIAGPIGCFGGMSIAAALCTKIIATPHGRFAMNGAEVIEQEAGPQEIDASDRDLVWQLVGSEARLKDGFIDAIVEDKAAALITAVHDSLRCPPITPARIENASTRLVILRREFAIGSLTLPHPRVDRFGQTESMAPSLDRGRLWLERLSGGNISCLLGTPSILGSDVSFGSGPSHTAIAIAICRDPNSILPRAANGELGLEQAWTLAEYLRRFVADEKISKVKRPILTIVDSPGQAFGRVEEQRCISVAAAAVVDAYAAARRSGHIVLTLIVGKAMSGSFLAHGMQSDHIAALDDAGVSMHVMSPLSVARITRRTLAEVETNSAKILPMSYAIQDAHRLGLIDALLPGIRVGAPTEEDLKYVNDYFLEKLAALRRADPAPRNIDDNPYRQATATVLRTMSDQWAAFDKALPCP